MKKLSYEKWIATFIQNLAQHFNLAGWQLKTEFFKEPKESSDGVCWADINTDSIYMQATIRIYPPVRKSWEERDIDRVVEVLTHEISHVLLDPLHEHAVSFLSDSTRPYFKNILENTTQRIAMVILNHFPKHLIPPR